MALPANHPHVGRLDTSTTKTPAESQVSAALGEARCQTASSAAPRRNASGISARVEEHKPRLGRNAERQHDFRHLSTVAFTSLVMGTWEILLTTNTAALRNGGLPGLFWSMVRCYFGQLFLVLSFAEMSSMVPASGGQYHWVSEFAPKEYRNVLSYCTGWLCSIGWQSRFTTDCYIVAGMIQALIEVNQPSYDAAHWQRGLICIAIVVTISAFNALAAGHLSLVEGFFALCHVFGLVPILVSLWVLADKQTPADVFVNFSVQGSGWNSLPLAVMVGQSTAFFTLLGSEAVIHIAEEIDNPGMMVPQCMTWSLFYNIPITLLTLVTYVFNIGSVSGSLDASQTPIIFTFQETFHAAQATTAFGTLILLLLMMVAVSTMVTASRHLFAFGRDRGLLYSGLLSRVHPTLQVPLNAILCTAFFSTTVILLAMGSQISLFMTFSTACLYVTYMISIGCLVWKRLRRKALPPAQWSLGRAGIWVNCVALAYTTWASFWSFWPTYEFITPANYNWTPLLFCFVACLALLAYVEGQRRGRRRGRRITDGPQHDLPPSGALLD